MTSYPSLCRIVFPAIALASCAATTELEIAPIERPRPQREFGDSTFIGCFQTLNESCASSDEFTINATIERDGASLLISATERNPETCGHNEWTMHEPIPNGVVERLVMRHTNDWYLAVRGETGEVRIERWQLHRDVGAYGSERATATTPIGVAWVTPPTVTSLEGGNYVIPKMRPRPTFTKNVIHPGLQLEYIDHMSIDPDGRFLLATFNPSGEYAELRRISLVAPVGESFTLLDSNFLPMLSQCDGQSFMQHKQLGRAIVMGLGDCIHLWDRENDGIFERVELLSFLHSMREYPFGCWSASY